MLQDSKLKLKIYWCYLCIFVIQAVICMQGINARKVSLPYADPGIFVGGGVQACLPENNPDNLFSPQLKYFTFDSCREEVRDPCMPP